MALSLSPPIWKEAPFLRLLIPFAAGIFLQPNLNLPTYWVLTILILVTFFFLLLHVSRPYFKFKYNWLTGLFIHIMLLGLGYLFCEGVDGTVKKDCSLNVYSPGQIVQLTLQEPLIEKPGSLKATASIDYIFKTDSPLKATGKVNIYFSKDISLSQLNYGYSILVTKTLQPITNSGNPGAFDYKLYCERLGIYHTVFLTSKDFQLVPKRNENVVKKYLYETKDRVLGILSRYIPGAKESGLAKALLIGYKDELDKNLVQAYASTGVVHIIAISGLHLGIIYWLLTLLFSPLQRIIRWKWPTIILILIGLWLFSFLAGAGPSVLRSAFMFSMIVLGRALSKHFNVFNNLAFSAFALLCYNPYWLWDAGFQLSYAAVLSIVLFFKWVYNWLYFTNKFIDFAWKLIAVTLSAQVLTLPISIYHFHQLPVYFVLSNLVAVPLSSLILIAEIMLCCVSFLPAVATTVGSITSWLIQVLNTYVQNINMLPHAVWGELQISFFQSLLMFFVIGGITGWLINKQKRALWIGVTSLLVFVAVRSYSFLSTSRQAKLIVYNLQNASAIDFINGRRFSTICNTESMKDPSSLEFTLKPSRILNRVTQSSSLKGYLRDGSMIWFAGKTILFIDKKSFIPTAENPIDVLILTNNSNIHLPLLIARFSPKQIIADASNKPYKVATWQKQADSLHIPFHNIRFEGAYVENLR